MKKISLITFILFIIFVIFRMLKGNHILTPTNEKLEYWRIILFISSIFSTLLFILINQFKKIKYVYFPLLIIITSLCMYLFIGNFYLRNIDFGISIKTDIKVKQYSDNLNWKINFIEVNGKTIYFPQNNNWEKPIENKELNKYIVRKSLLQEYYYIDLIKDN
ncbi:hypothetical protein [Flavobacterium celericrescens]|uniref:DUF5673 domain-containing protein n=1 Tax=Flavobacterium celericrescens TaxID=2709780 RepID=A0ABX0ID73_9FLAO|nr:hypothetical protein [Flavobacterium celericrescens]NHM03340.1 hypothetical protein [Flavobacterium celericrescens]